MLHLTGQNFSPREIIQNVFSPLVGVLSSPLADEMCHKNNLSFVEMLQPFSKLTNDAHFRDTSGTSVSIKGLRLNICDIGWRPPQTVLARKMLNESVTNGYKNKTKIVNVGSLNLEIPISEPWFESWRETFLTVQFPSDHEFTRHFLSCLIILASSDPNILETANQLTKQISMLQNVPPQKLPKWFSNDALNSYVLLHDGSQGDITKAQQSYELLKSTFGENKCFLVQINSVTDNPVECPDPWIRYIKRQPKDTPADQSSTPKTPQDISAVTAMPTVQVTNVEIPSDNENFSHPLSPVQEQATEAIHSKYSTSNESLNFQTINPNVWASEIDIDVPHGVWLTALDVENLRHFVQDYTVRALIPYVEKLVGILNEAITTKKGVSKSLLSATKRWFITNKPGANSTQNAVIYTAESAELQTRKLGDLYFMFGNYSLAFQAYHQAKRDFNADSAWQYYAGALEMAALSAFMLGTSNRKTYDYMEDAIVCYLTVCKLPQFATRATMLSVECLKQAHLYGEAAKQLIRMTSEDSDLRSALLLEQASYCFLASQQPMYRKYAFHIVLSGNRYSRAGQRKHAFRCYKQAYQVFEDRGWSLAEDHIQYTIGKQAVTLKKLNVASKSLAHLLRARSLQNVTQQAAFLKEYIATQKELLSRSPEIGLLEIALPKVIQSSIRVLVISHPPVMNPQYVSATDINIQTNLKDEHKWQKLEEMIIQTVSYKPIVFKPTQNLFTSENLTIENPLGIHGEPIELSVEIINAIKPSIKFSDINLLWEFIQENGEIISNKILYERDINEENKNVIMSAVTSTQIDEIILNEHEEKMICFKLTPKLIGQLKIIGIVGKISATTEPGSLQGYIYFEPQQIKSTGKSIVSNDRNIIQFDNRLNIKILPPAPTLQVSFSKIPYDIITGEIIPVTICLNNSGMSSISDIYIAFENPRWVTLVDDDAELPLSVLKEFKDFTNENLSKDKEIRKQHVFKILKNSINASLNSNETKTIPMWIQAPFKKDKFKLRLLIYYAMPSDYQKIRHRLIRHEWELNVHESVQVEACCVISNLIKNDLALDFELKNVNQTHHPFMTEVYLNSIDLYCSSYKLKPDKVIYINQMEISQGILNEKCLKSSKSSSFRCELFESNNSENTNCDNKNMMKFIENRLSSVNINSQSTAKLFTQQSQQQQKQQHNQNYEIPSIMKIYSFLMKNETKYLNTFGVPINTEEFNSILSLIDKHMTIIINWNALVIDTTSAQRYAIGQHFIQLRNLYEQISCPEKPDYRIKTYLSSVDHNNQLTSSSYHKIYEFKNYQKTNNNIINGPEDDDDQWEFNNNFVGKRCLLEDEINKSSSIVNVQTIIQN